MTATVPTTARAAGIAELNDETTDFLELDRYNRAVDELNSLRGSLFGEYHTHAVACIDGEAEPDEKIIAEVGKTMDEFLAMVREARETLYQNFVRAFAGNDWSLSRLQGVISRAGKTAADFDADVKLQQEQTSIF